MTAKSDRRTFIRQTALGGMGLVILSDSRSARTYAANERLNIALVGCGGRGSWFVGAVPNMGHNLAVFCDVDERRAASSFTKQPNVPRVQDYRKMLEEMGKQIDAVIIAVPDHTHAIIASAAMKAGKPVYCEKPMTHTVHEARALAETAARLKIVTQMGNQGGYNTKVVNLVRAGVIGDITEVFMWNTGGGPGPRPRPEAMEVPQGLAWDLWLGPAAYRPYHTHWMQGGWRDFRTGQLGNWGPHTMATTYKALKIDTLWQTPKEGAEKPVLRVTAECSELSPERFPKWEMVHWDVPAREGMPPVRINWHNADSPTLTAQGRRAFYEERIGRKLDWGDAGTNKWDDWQGNLLVGSKGMLHTRAHGCAVFQLLPKEKFASVPDVPNSLPQPLGQPAESGWINAIRGGVAPQSSFDGFAGAFTQFYLLGNVATLFPNVTLEYDPIAGKITNNAQADAALRCEYRKGWSL